MLRQPLVLNVWGQYRRQQLHKTYLRRREHYAVAATERGLRYREQDTVAAARARVAGRGYQPRPKQCGDIHTFAFVPRTSWHSALYSDLALLGPVSEFDYAAYGYRPHHFYPPSEKALVARRQMQSLVIPALLEAHRSRPIDWVFVYANGSEISAGLIREIVERIGVPVVNMCLDDKQSWTGPTVDGQRIGQIDIAREFDISWTSARVACEWYLVEGARPIYMPEGFDKSRFRPLPEKKDLLVSFVGGAYGFRPSVRDQLERFGIDLHAFGPGWGTRTVSVEEQVRIFNRSVVNLGMGGIGYSEALTNVKGRDFEIPGTGGGVYVTSFNADLAQHFHIGHEILCYSSLEEMVEVIRHCVANPDETRGISERGRQRCLLEHRWLHRYTRLCEILGIMGKTQEAETRSPPDAATV